VEVVGVVMFVGNIIVQVRLILIVSFADGIFVMPVMK